MEKKLEEKQNLTKKRRNISWGKEMEMRGERIKKNECIMQVHRSKSCDQKSYIIFLLPFEKKY